MRLHTSHRTHESELAREGEEDEKDPPARERLPRRMAEGPDGGGGADASPATAAAMLRFADAVHAGVHEARGSAPEHAAGRAVAEADTSGGVPVPRTWQRGSREPATTSAACACTRAHRPQQPLAR